MKFIVNKNYGLCFVSGLWLFVTNLSYLPVWGQNKSESLCAQQSLELITTNLLRDLPNYANRASQRARRLTRRGDTFSYMLTAGRPEFKPLPLNPNITSEDTAKTLSSGVEQIFFTTLERKYIAKQAVELQEFHWLLLTKTSGGWRKVMMFTQTGSFPVSKVLSPPRDSSDGVIGTAVDTWLRDCQAGSVGVREIKKPGLFMK